MKLNDKFQNSLKGRIWNRVKSIEQLQEQDTSAVSPPMNTPDLNKALCYVLGFQLVEVEENSKKITLYPNDIRVWTKEYPIYIVSQGSRSIYIEQKIEEARPFFKKWFYDLEKLGFQYIWPTTDGTVKEIKEKLESFQLFYNKIHKKEYNSEILGKAESIKHINNEF